MSVKDAPSPPENEVIERGHELDILNRRFLVLTTFGLVMLMALALLLAYMLSNYLSRGMVVDRQARPTPSPQTAGVRVTADQPQQLKELRQSEDERLNNYGWLVEPEGIGRIPIQRAMEILAKNGFQAPKTDTENPPGNEEKPEAEKQPDAEGQDDNAN